MRTERLTIEPIDRRHVDDLIDAIEASLDELKEWMAWAVDWQPSESRQYLLQRSDNDHPFAVCLEGKPIGLADVLVAKPPMRWGELGYWMSTPHAGKGYTTEALDAVITWAFTELGLHRLELRAGVSNVGSNRIAEKLGFDLRGVTRESARGARGFYDCNLWELLESDPRPTT